LPRKLLGRISGADRELLVTILRRLATPPAGQSGSQRRAAADILDW
jgi:hypothetical protein